MPTEKNTNKNNKNKHHDDDDNDFINPIKQVVVAAAMQKVDDGDDNDNDDDNDEYVLHNNKSNNTKYKITRPKLQPNMENKFHCMRMMRTMRMMMSLMFCLHPKERHDTRARTIRKRVAKEEVMVVAGIKSFKICTRMTIMMLMRRI